MIDHEHMAGALSLGDGSFRGRLRSFLENDIVEVALAILIIINGIMLGLETAPSIVASFGSIIELADDFILGIFVIELLTRMYAYGGRFWTNPWSLFDLVVVGLSLIPASGNLSVLRALRVVRALRLISAVPSVRQVVNGLIGAIPGMGAVILLIGIVFYVFSVMATRLYGDTFPQFFGTLGESAFSLFQVMTLEAWSDSIVRPMLNVHPYAWAFFIPFILLTSFVVLNLFIGIIVEGMQEETKSQQKVAERQKERRQEDLIDEVRALRREIEALRNDRRT